MPIYAYKCETCGHAKDVLQKMSDPLLTDCPACGASTFKKQLTAAGFQLKGSGWYATDFKNGGTPATTVPAGEKSDSGASVNTDAKTDNKAGTKADTSSGDSKTEAKSVTKTETSAATQSTSKPTESTSSKPAAASGGGCAVGCGCH
jgi:putative FmdB family regulatory protein